MKTINIKGKEYVPVVERVKEAHKLDEKVSILSEVIADTEDYVSIKSTVTFKGIVYTGHSSASKKTGMMKDVALEVAETSAIGRALACLGIGGTEFASANEVVNAIHQQTNPVKEVVTEAALTVAKNKLLEASKEGKLKEAFFALTPAVQEELREYANDLKKSA